MFLFLVYICFWCLWSLKKIKTYVVIEVDGEIYEKISLGAEWPENKNRCSCNFRKKRYWKWIDIVSEWFTQIVPSNDCVRQGWIGCPGQIIVCLPNRVVIKIIASKNLPDEPDAVSF